MQKIKEGKILAVDWGSKRIGLAISDLSRTLSRPLTILMHTSREDNAKRIVQLAEAEKAEVILVGVTYQDDGEFTPSGRSAKRLADEIKPLTSAEIILWDEDFSTKEVESLLAAMGKSRKRRAKPIDDLSAAKFLQNYLDKI